MIKEKKVYNKQNRKKIFRVWKQDTHTNRALTRKKNVKRHTSNVWIFPQKVILERIANYDGLLMLQKVTMSFCLFYNKDSSSQ